jgi:hypothetical protein
MTLAIELDEIKEAYKMAGLKAIEKSLTPICEYLSANKEKTAIKAVFIRFTYDDLADYYADAKASYKSDFIFSRSGNPKVFNFVEGGLDYSFEEHGSVDIFSNSFSKEDITFIKSLLSDKSFLQSIHDFMCDNLTVSDGDLFSISDEEVTISLKYCPAPEYKFVQPERD